MQTVTSYGRGETSRREILLRLIAAGLVMAGLGTLYSWSVFIAYIEPILGQSRTHTSSIFAAAVVCFTLGMLLAPKLAKPSSLLGRALLACAVAAAGLALCSVNLDSWAVFMGYGVLFGLGNGIGYSLSLQAVQAGPSERRGTLTGIAVACYMLGSVISTPILYAILNAWGLEPTFLLLALLLLMVGCTASLILKGLQDPTSVAADIEDIGMGLPYTPQREFGLLWIYFFLASLVGMMIIGHAAPLLSSLGGSRAQLALGVTLTSAGNGLGRVTGGWLVDLLPRQLLLVATAAFSCAGLAIVLWSTQPDASIFALFMVGSAYGCVASALPSIIAQRYGAHRLADIYGSLFTAWGIAGLVGPLSAGWMFDLSGNYRRAMSMAILAAGGAMLAAGAICPPRRREPPRAT